MDKLNTLVIEDDPLFRKVMASTLGLCEAPAGARSSAKGAGTLAGHAIDFAENAAVAKEKLEKDHYDLCFIDLKLGDRDNYSGLKLIALARSKGIYSVVMSSHDTEPFIQKAYELGCDDFYAKGNEDNNVSQVLARFWQKREKSKEENIFKERFITEDSATKLAIGEALKYAPSDLPILILGPSGAGKTSLARLVHDFSRRKGEFVAINCSAYTEDLLEAELFGYKKGAFTGANETRKGKLLLADRGTLFLDEIGAMSLKMQTKLLKAIEEKTFYPVGSDIPETSSFRVISATLEDLQCLINEGRLRFDFFQRIHGLTIRLKPLSERKDDIFPLISFFTKQGRRLSFTQEAKTELLGYNWPGSVRELKKLADLLMAGEEGRVQAETVKRLLNSLRPEEGASGFATDEQYRFALRQGLNEAVDRFIDGIVETGLKAHNNRKYATMRDLGISSRMLYDSLKRLNVPLRKSTRRKPPVPITSIDTATATGRISVPEALRSGTAAISNVNSIEVKEEVVA
ncbi:MAG: sigma-54-dependent Fis family transcriptional regulator [Elusimicrobia bacterium]|nr:sigma-54-dependent Fis family transcriptional regulator [Elusimicrobiota bacterium]